MAFSVTKVVTTGLSSPDAQDVDVQNNVWVVGDDDGLVIIDAAHDAHAIAAVVDHRRVQAIICTHGHHDHINAAPELSDLVTAPIYLAAADRALWTLLHPGRDPYDELREGDVFRVGGELMHVLPTPGRSPGGICLYVPGQNILFGGDTFSSGGPQSAERSAGDLPPLLESIRLRLLVLPPHTVVQPAHGDDTTIGAHVPNDEAWVARGRPS
jgi:glyoxylase-like metal-dependent hydrolase (beta-lactamase superfamily II)